MSRGISKPKHRRIVRGTYELTRDLDKFPTIKEVATYTGLTGNGVTQALRAEALDSMLDVLPPDVEKITRSTPETLRRLRLTKAGTREAGFLLPLRDAVQIIPTPEAEPTQPIELPKAVLNE